MTNEELDQILDQAFSIQDGMLPSHWVDRIRTLPVFGTPLAERLEPTADLLDEWLKDPLSEATEKHIKDIAHWLNDRTNGINDAVDQMMKDFSKYVHDSIPSDPNTPQPDPNNPIPDQDKDGIPDDKDSDRDGDGIPNDKDSSPDGVPPPQPDPKNPHQPPYDPTRPGMHDPLALDMNQDGQISTISLADSQVYFDLTGDGVKEKVGWIQAVDGLVAYDKNRNGTIDGISEVFGKEGLSGFAELRQVADSNYDGIIDRRDELYSQLKVWQDLNQDGISQANELKTLSEAGVKNIELNVIGTNINLNGNLLSEAGRYGDSTGTRSLAADMQLMTLEKVSSNPSAIETYEIDPITETLPHLRGYGYIDNSFKTYNLDPKLKELALEFMNDKESASANFRWSRFYDMAKSKGFSEITHTFKSNSTQRKAA